MAVRGCFFAAAALTGAVRLAAGSGEFTTVAQHDNRRGTIDLPAAAVSRSGGHVAFASYARLVPADTDDARDIYVLERASACVTLESGPDDGSPAAADSSHPGISDDGRFLVYQTAIGVGGAPHWAVVLRDRVVGSSTVMASGLVSAWSGAPAISADGRFVAFVSDAADGVTGNAISGHSIEVYVLDRSSRAIDRVSVDRDGRQLAGGASFAPAISGDGRRVAFVSTAALAGADAPIAGAPILERPRVPQIYVRDRVARTTVLVSGGHGGAAADGPAWHPAIDAAGQHVAFVSTATTLAPDDRTRGADVFVADLATGRLELISRSARDGPGNGPSASPALSADGRLVAFQSEASDLRCAGRCTAATEDINLLPDVYLFDRRTGEVSRASGDAAGGWLEASAGPAIDGSGAVVAFSSRHPIDASDTRNDFDLFIKARGGAPRSAGGCAVRPLQVTRAAAPRDERFTDGRIRR